MECKQNIPCKTRTGLTPFISLRTKWIVKNQGTTEKNSDIDKKGAVVIWGGLGFQRKITSHKAVFIEFRIEKYMEYIGFCSPTLGGMYIPFTVFNKMLVFNVKF